MLSQRDKAFLNYTDTVATVSPDPSTKVGAVLAPNGPAIGRMYTGFNQPVVRLAGYDEERSTRLGVTIHAEMAALLHTEPGTLEEYTLYCTHAPCGACTKALLFAGVKRFVWRRKPEYEARWSDEINFSERMILASGAELIRV